MSQTAREAADDILTFKIASEPGEFEQIHRLNYRTFVEEIPQHAPNEAGALVDKFDRDNTYFICSRAGRVIGMLAIRATRPFSLDSKVEQLDSYLPAGHRFCEVRLLAVDPGHRSGVVLRGLLRTMNEFSLTAGFDAAVISGAVEQLRLYQHMGFVQFGPRVGTAEAPYQPMYITRDAWAEIENGMLGASKTETNGAVAANGANGAHHNGANGAGALKHPSNGAHSTYHETFENFLPGPVSIHPDVWAAFVRTPVSHRHPDFADDLATTQRVLTTLVGSQRVQLLVGSGTLANDVVGAQLSLLRTPGIVLTNGEFGDRLVDHAARLHLPHTVVRVPWGGVFAMDVIERAVDALPRGGWCWMVHCETSSGVLNELRGIQAMCAARGVHLAADCVSSIGTMPVDLRGVYLASGVSGKALAALPGLSMVFHDHEVAASSDLPRYLDLGYYADKGGVPFTHSSNLLAALRVAAERTARRAPFTELASVATWLRSRLRDMRFDLVADEAHSSPGVVSLAIPGEGNGTAFGDRLADAGFELSYRSDYLRRRDWVQIALMSDCSRDRIERLLGAMQELRVAR